MPELEKWSANQMEFAWWLAQPRDQREPKTQRAFAKLLGVSEWTLSNWKRTRGFTDLVHEQVIKVLGFRWPQVLDAMVREALKGNVEAAKFVGKVLKRYSDRMEVAGDSTRPVLFKIVTGVAPPPPEEPCLAEGPVIAGELAGPDQRESEDGS